MDPNKITKEKFLDYERVRESGVTNMFLVTNVCELSGLNRDEVIDIMQHYTFFKKLYAEDNSNN